MIQNYADTDGLVEGQAKSALSVEAVKSLEGLAALGLEWAALWESAPTATPYVAWEWMHCWWQTLGCQGKMFNLLVRDDAGRLIAIAPLMRVIRGWKGLGVREVRFATDRADSAPGDLDLILAPGRAEAALREILAYLCDDPWWDRLWLARMRADSENLMLLCDMAVERGLRVEIRQRLPAAYARLPRTFDEYLAGLGTKTRSRVRQWRRQFTTRHGGRARMCENAEEADRVLSHLMSFKVDRMREKGQATQFTSDRYRDFMRMVCRAFQEQGTLRLTYLEMEGRPVAGMLGLVHRGTWYSHDLFWDPVHDKLALGHLGIVQAVEAAIEEGCEVNDLLQGVAHHKSRFATCTRNTVNVCIYRPTRRSVLVECSAHVAAAAKHLLRGNGTRRGRSIGERAQPMAVRQDACPRGVRAALGTIKRFVAPLVRVNIRTAVRAALEGQPSTLVERAVPSRLVRAEASHLERWIHVCEGRSTQVPVRERSTWPLEADQQIRLASGQQAWCALVGGAPVSVVWAGAGPFSSRFRTPRRLRLGPRDAYIYYAFTLPEFRRRGLYSALLCLIKEEMQARGMDRVYAVAWHRNLPSIHAMTRAGLEPFATIVVIRLLSRFEFALALRRRKRTQPAGRAEKSEGPQGAL
jgi:CelD/BcsL family acetyltransferase involved in cellulose biosynthesis/ribosomal protein S18 acetylase RimI-like enzyme